MDEYLKREDALKIIDNYSKAVTEEGMVVVNAIRDIVAIITPTADVIPRSDYDAVIAAQESLQKYIATQGAEIERLKKLLDDECNECIERERAKVVREIFEEIEKIIDKHHSECYEYEDGDECDTAITYISYISCDISELKKKYLPKGE